MRKVTGRQRYAREIKEMAMVNMKAFRDFDEIDIFSDKYYIVSKDGKYNLVDRNGKLLVNTWFESIEQTEDGIEIKTEKGQNVVLTPKEVTFGAVKAISTLDRITLPKGLTFSDIKYIQPYLMNTGIATTITIIAKVVYKGQELLLDENGVIRNQDGSVFSETEKDDNNDSKEDKEDVFEYQGITFRIPDVLGLYDVYKRVEADSKKRSLKFFMNQYGEPYYQDESVVDFFDTLQYKNLTLNVFFSFYSSECDGNYDLTCILSDNNDIYISGIDQIINIGIEELVDMIRKNKKDYAVEKTVNKSKKHLNESSDEDGWSVTYAFRQAMNRMDEIDYELRNCIRGAYTGCHTYRELADYIRDVLVELEDALKEMEMKKD